MKRFLLATIFLWSGFIVLAQETTYISKLDIQYYPDKIAKSDEYISERCVLDIYYPTNIKNFATIIWFHGGSLKSGNKSFPKALLGQGFCIIAPNYRLYPKVNAPKYIEDAAAAVAWVFNKISGFGGDSTKIFLSGHSAGGYLDLMVGLDKRWLKVHDIDANKVAGLIPFSGQTITHFTIRKERGIPEIQPIIDDLAPLYHVRFDAPPLLLITGDRELELLGRYEENAYMMRMMKLTGHNKTKLYELDGYGHGMTEPAFPLLLKEVRRIIEESKK